MQLYNAEVCLGGLLTNTVFKENLTASEILILRSQHGDESIRSIKPTKVIKRPYQEEYNRLLLNYGPKKVGKAFPGARPVLPEKLADVGIIVNEDGHAITEVLASGKNNKDRKTKRQQELDDIGIENDDDEDIDLKGDDEE